MSNGMSPLPFDEDERPEQLSPPPADAACLYVATKITGTAPGSPERQIIQFGATAITDAIVETTRDSGSPWHVRVHAPVAWTTPEQTPELSSDEVFIRNAHHVLAQADALIVYGWAASAGVGQELTWAALMVGLPVLYIEPPGHHTSRQIRGTPGDVTVTTYAAPDHLKEEVRRWLRQRRHQVEASASRRQGRAARFGPLFARLNHAWIAAGQAERVRVAAHLGLMPNLIEWWLRDVAFLAAAPMAHVVLLATELTGSTDAVVGRHELTLDELEALLTARDEHGWDAETTAALRRQGEMELAQPAIRRFSLTSPENWLRLYEAMHQ